MNSIPTIVYYPRYINPESNMHDYTLEIEYETPEDILEWVTVIGGLDLQQDFYEDDNKLSQFSISKKTLSVFITLFYSLLLCNISNIGNTIMDLYHSNKFYRILSLFILFFSVSGFINCIISNPPWFIEISFLSIFINLN